MDSDKFSESGITYETESNFIVIIIISHLLECVLGIACEITGAITHERYDGGSENIYRAEQMIIILV